MPPASMDMPRAVVALGGNAVTPEGEAGFDVQLETIRETVDRLAALRADGYELSVTHGNGPQVGARLRQQETTDTPSMPLDVLVAETQAQLGAMLQRVLDDALDEEFLTVVTQAIVDPDDPAFSEPTKPIGPYYTATEAEERSFETAKVRDEKPAYRRVVASPEPQSVVESGEIAAMVDRGQGVICGGGGGVPVARTERGLVGVEAVIDKDYTTQLLATAIEADVLLFLTDVEGIYLDYGGDDQRLLRDVDAETLRERHERGVFPPGSMGPKVESCLRFLDAGGDRAIVCRPDEADAAVRGDAGTQIR